MSLMPRIVRLTSVRRWRIEGCGLPGESGDESQPSGRTKILNTTGQITVITRTPGIRQFEVGDCRSPGYQATLYTIVSTKPWYQLTFVGSDSHGVYRLDPATGKTELVFDDPGYHDIQAKIVSARPEPDGRSSVVTEKDRYGKLYCLACI